MMSGNGLPTCDFYVPPPPVQPPAAAYPFVYAASLFMFDIGQVKYVTKVERVTGSGGWQIASQVNSNYYGPPLYFPWGSGDLSFVWNGGAPSPPSDLNDAMQWFAGQGCRVLTMDSSIQSLVNDAVSANGWPSGASLSIMSTWPPTPRWGGSAWINYAACPSAVM